MTDKDDLYLLLLAGLGVVVAIYLIYLAYTDRKYWSGEDEDDQ